MALGLSRCPVEKFMREISFSGWGGQTQVSWLSISAACDGLRGSPLGGSRLVESTSHIAAIAQYLTGHGGVSIRSGRALRKRACFSQARKHPPPP